VIFKGATVQGIYGRRLFETWIQMNELLRHKQLNLEPLFGVRLPLNNFAEAFDKLQQGIAGKVLFYPNGRT
jgi:threonine 3-dehydrogenase